MEQKRNTYKCPHHYAKYKCPLCNMHMMCKHHKYQKSCIKCNLSLVCVHKKDKYSCVLCKPYLLCIHIIRRHKCKNCKIYYSKAFKMIENNIEKTLCIHNCIDTECIFCFLINFK